MKRKVLAVAGDTEARVKARMALARELRCSVEDIYTAEYSQAVGVCKEMAPAIVIICPGDKSSLVYDKIKEILPSQRIVRAGYDQLPTTL